MFHLTLPAVDYRIFLANVLLPSGCCLPGQRKSQGEGNGYRYFQVGRVPGCAEQDEQSRGVEDCDQALGSAWARVRTISAVSLYLCVTLG